MIFAKFWLVFIQKRAKMANLKYFLYKNNNLFQKHLLYIYGTSGLHISEILLLRFLNRGAGLYISLLIFNSHRWRLF